VCIHDALLREWGQLRGWLKEQREFYLWRQRLDERLREWKAGKGDLLRGAALTEAEQKLANSPTDLNQAEQTYILKSLTLQRRINFGIAAAVALVLVMLAMFAWVQRNQAITQSNLAGTAVAAEVTSDVRRQESDYARATAEIAQANEEAKRIEAEEAETEAEARRVEVEEQQRETERQRKIAVARQLGTQAELNLDTSALGQIRSLLLAVESLQEFPTIEGDRILRKGLDLMPRRILSEADGRVFAFSPNGKWFATGNGIWDIETKRQLIDFEEKNVTSIKFSPNNKWLVIIVRNYDDSFNPDDRILVLSADNGVKETELVYNLQSSPSTIAFSPNSRWLAIDFGDLTQVWATDSWQTVTQLTRDNNPISSLVSSSFSPDGRLFAKHIDGSVIKLLETNTWQEATEIEHDGFVIDFAFFADSKKMATITIDSIKIWDLVENKQIGQFAHNSRLTALYSDIHFAISPNGKYLAAAGDSIVPVWDVEIGQLVTWIRPTFINDGSSKSTFAVAFSPDSRLLATGIKDGLVQIWDVASNEELTRIPVDPIHHYTPINTLEFSPNGNWLAIETGSLNGVQLWEVSANSTKLSLRGDKTLSYVTFSPDNKWLLADSYPYIWNISTGQEMAIATKIQSHQFRTSFPFSFDGKLAALAGISNTISVEDFNEQTEIIKIPLDSPAQSLTFGPDNSLLAFESGNNINIWDITQGHLKQQIDSGSDVNGLMFSPDGHYLATLYSPIRIWDITNGQELVSLFQQMSGRFVGFTPDSRIAVTRNISGTEVQIWDLLTLEERFKIWLDSESGFATDISPDGRWLATETWTTLSGKNTGSGIIRIWELTTGREVTQMTFDELVNDIKFSSDGKWLGFGSEDGRARILSVGDWEQMVEVGTHNEPVETVAFSPDGKYFATGAEDETIYVWFLRPEDLIKEACSRLFRNLTYQEWKQFFPAQAYRRTCPTLPVHDSVITEIVARQDWALVSEDNPENLPAVYETLVQWAQETHNAGNNASICWYGTIDGLNEIVMPSCQYAIQLDPQNTWVRNSRGFVRALAGDYVGAIEDFQFYIEELSRVSNTHVQENIRQRQTWVDELKQRNNPFDPETLETLRNE